MFRKKNIFFLNRIDHGCDLCEHGLYELDLTDSVTYIENRLNELNNLGGIIYEPV